MATRGSPNTDVIRILTKRSWGFRSPVKKNARQRGRVRIDGSRRVDILEKINIGRKRVNGGVTEIITI